MFKTPRKRPYQVAIEGFSDFERSALASFFRLAERRVPAYVQAESSDECDFLIADADQTRVLDRITRSNRAATTVFIGAQAPDDAQAWLPRPIEPVHIMRALDGLLGGQRERSDPFQGDDSIDPSDSTAKDLPGTDEAALTEPTREPKLRRNPATTPRGGSERQVLVVDDSAIARTFLAQRLRGLGYRVTLAPTGEEALESTAQTPFAIVFLDIDLGSASRLDGLQVCQKIKQRATHPEGVAPAVVITTGRTGATDRVRGSLAGCDAYLTKPLMEAEFNAALHQVDPLFGYAAAG